MIYITESDEEEQVKQDDVDDKLDFEDTSNGVRSSTIVLVVTHSCCL